MGDSDEDYVQEVSDDEVEAHRVTRGKGGRSDSSRGAGQRGKGGGWEVTRTWEKVVESEDGTINATVEELLEAGKRRR